MKEAENPYGDGTAACKTVDAIEDFYQKGLLTIESPDEVATTFERKIEPVSENITVSEFEEKNNAYIHLVYNGDKMEFPYGDLELAGKMISYDLYK